MVWERWCEGRCHQFPRLPRETKVDFTKYHAYHAKRRYVSPSATPATQSTAASPATNPGQSAPKRATKRNKCHACHAKRRWRSPNATPATRNEGACRQVPRLPRKTKVDVTKRHTCHVKRRWMSPSATRATGRWCVTKLCVKDGGWQRCVWKMVGNKVVCERWCVTKLGCVSKMVGNKVVCERWCVTKLCVKDGVWRCERWCVTKLCVKDGVWKMVVDKDVCERW